MTKKKLVLYHNARCSKSRATLEIIEKESAELRIVNYLETPPTADELDQLLQQLGMEPAQLARSQEEVFKELGLDRNPPSSREEWLRVLVAHPILIERPIVTDGKRAVIGRPPENVKKLLS